MLSYTPQHRRFLASGFRCENCHRMLLAGPRYTHPDGRPVAKLAMLATADAVAVCTKCSFRWPVYLEGVPLQQPGVIPQQQGAVTPVPHPGAGTGPGVGQVQPILPSIGTRTVEVVETRRFEEPIGEEKRTIDNSGPATSTRRIKVSKRWLRKYEMSAERAQSRKFGGKLPKALIIELSGEAETRLQRSYSVGGEEEQTFEEEIELTIPPRSIVTLVLSWKRIWQEGVVAVVQPDGERIEVPYRVVVGVTFDQAST